MTDEDHLRHYLAGRAGAISLPPGEPGAIVERAQRRRRQRRAVALATVSVLAAVTTGALVAREPGKAPVESTAPAGPGLIPSTLHWNVVEPETGLGFVRSLALAGDGALYSLSTAPGASGLGASDLRSRLYRSDDGTNWAQQELPDDLWASALAIGNGRLYAVGTSPAGGQLGEAVVASWVDGGSWYTQSLPLPLAGLQARHPNQVRISAMSVATGPDTVVAAVVLRGQPDIPALLPDGVDTSGGLVESAEGVQILVPVEPVPCGDIVPTDEDGAVAMCREDRPIPPGLDPGTMFTWEELGLDPELRPLMGGQLHLFVSTGGEFSPVQIPVDDMRGVDTVQLVEAPGGYRLVLGHTDMGDAATTAVLRSADGRTWEQDPSASLTGSPMAAGMLAGRPAVVLRGDRDGSARLAVEAADGSWSTADLLAVVDDQWADGSHFVSEAAFGPLGLAVLVWGQPNGLAAPDVSVVHSADGTSLSVVSLDDYVPTDDEGTFVSGLTVTADAITVRVAEEDGKVNTPMEQRLVVGTPE